MTATRGSVGRRDVSADRALTDSGDVFRRLASSSPIGILLFDTEGRLTFANERWRETVGIGSDEPVSDFDWIEFIHPEDCEEVVGTARHTSAGDGIADLEFRFVRRDGQLRWSRTRSAAVCDLNGEVRGFVATCEDITAEREAAETRHRLTQALETTPDYVVVLEADGRVVYANETVREEAALHGRVDLGALAAPSTFTAESWTTIVHEAWPALCEKGSWQGELTAVRRDGTPVPVILSARAHRSDDGEVVYVSAIARDISDIKRFEQQLAKSEALFRALVERSHDLVALFDTDGCFAYASPSHFSVLGYEPSDLIGRRALDLIHPEDREPIAAAFAAQLIGGAPTQPIELRLRHKSGSYVWIEAVAQNRLDDPAVQGMIVNARDVTERKRAEQLAADEANILEQVARGAPLEETLVSVVGMVEHVIPDGVCVLTAPGPADRPVEVLAAPNLGAEAIHALEIQPSLPPEPFAEDVFTRDLEDLTEATSGARGALLADGFRSAWVAPLLSVATGDALGDLLVLRRDRSLPSPADHQILSLAGSVAAIAIAREREVTHLARAARRDPLTGLPNRTEAIDRLAAIGRIDTEVTAVLFLDLDRFKLLNDSHGHVAGDRVLVEIGRRLRAVTRPGDLVARLGGDEFVLVCDHLSEPDEAVEIAERVLRVVREPLAIGEREVVVTTSVGIATGTGEPEAVLRDADTAMYLAKERGRDRVEQFDPRGPQEPVGA